MSPEIVVVLVIFGAVLVQSLVGFGSALISMPLLAPVLGIKVAAPTFALLALVMEVIIIARHRADFRWRAVWRLMVAALIGIQIGVRAASLVDERVMLILLGMITSGYGIYALTRPLLPKLEHPVWAYGLGFLSGILSGAYNTGGPPYIIYGTSQQWSAGEFKANIQSLFIVGSLGVISGHFFNHNITPEVLRYCLFALPALAVGLLLGFYLDHHIDPTKFRKGVLMMLVVLGLTLIF